MLVREFLSIRRAYNLVRQSGEASARLSFEELGILAHLSLNNSALRASDLANAQAALRPTMTHRMNHLEKKGFISRSEGPSDHRNIVCKISSLGRKKLDAALTSMKDFIRTSDALARTTAERLIRYVDAMQSVYVDASDLVLLSLYASDNAGKSISELVGDLGFLQPTVSMSVASLMEQGFCTKRSAGENPSGHTRIFLSKKGEQRAAELASAIEKLVVHRLA